MRCWALMEFIDINGVKYEPGEEIFLARNTDQEKATFAKLESFGIVTTKEREAEAKTDPPENPSGRTGRKRP